MSRLAAEGVRVVWNGRVVLDGVSMRVSTGEIVGLLGPNGSGKSTLLKVLSGLVRPAEGGVCLDGRPIRSLPRSRVAARLGYLPQGAGSDWPLRVRHVVSLGRTPHLSTLQTLGEADRIAVDRALELVDCAHLADRPVTALSGGERSRAMIARVLAGEPELLLLDEPVTGLDPRHQLDMMDLLRRMSATGRRRGVVVVLHDLTLAARFCDRVCLLAGGHTVASGPTAAVLTAPAIARTFDVEVAMVDAGNGPVPVPVGPAGPAAA